MLAVNRNAIWNAVADLIEEHPANYRFWETEVPGEGGGGCLWGLAGRMIGVPEGADICHVPDAMGYTQEMLVELSGHETADPETALYNAMTNAMTHEEMKREAHTGFAFMYWTKDAKFAAELLRRIFPVMVAA